MCSDPRLHGDLDEIPSELLVGIFYLIISYAAGSYCPNSVDGSIKEIEKG